MVPQAVNPRRRYQGREPGQELVVREEEDLPSNPLGGYGQYYQGSIYNLGFTSRSEDDVDRVTEGLATRLAEAVDRTLAPSPYIRSRHFKNANHV